MLPTLHAALIYQCPQNAELPQLIVYFIDEIKYHQMLKTSTHTNIYLCKLFPIQDIHKMYFLYYFLFCPPVQCTCKWIFIPHIWIIFFSKDKSLTRKSAINLLMPFECLITSLIRISSAQWRAYSGSQYG